MIIHAQPAVILLRLDVRDVPPNVPHVVISIPVHPVPPTTLIQVVTVYKLIPICSQWHCRSIQSLREIQLYLFKSNPVFYPTIYPQICKVKC